MKSKHLPLIVLFLASASLAHGKASKLKCELNFQTLNEIFTWRLTDDEGKTRSEVNFGSKEECRPYAESLNGDYFCSQIMMAPGQGYKQVVASFSKNSVVSVLAMSPQGERRTCVDHLRKQSIENDFLCVGTAYKWSILNLKNSQLIKKEFGSFEECTRSLPEASVLSDAYGATVAFERFKDRPISNRFYYITKLESSEPRSYQVGPEGLEVQLGMPEDCVVDKREVWCSNPKLRLPSKMIVRVNGQRMAFLVNKAKAWFTLPGPYIQTVSFDGPVVVDGHRFNFGFVTHQTSDE